MNTVVKNKPAEHSESLAHLRIAPSIASKYDITGIAHESVHTQTLFGTDKQSGEQVLIKAVRTDSMTRGARARLEHEASIRHQFSSERLARVRHYDQDEGTFYIVLPLVTGTRLSDHLQHGPLSVEETLLVAKHLFTALRDLHQHGALHRDIKPANILINDMGETLESVRWSTLVDVGII